jgi:hypothetical protein
MIAFATVIVIVVIRGRENTVVGSAVITAVSTAVVHGKSKNL